MWPFKKRERRHWARRAVQLDVMYGPEPPLTLTTSVDMAAHSLAFRSSQIYEAGTKLEVRVLLDPSDPENGWFEANAQVTRTDVGIVAVEFADVSDAAAHRMDEFFMRSESASTQAAH